MALVNTLKNALCDIGNRGNTKVTRGVTAIDQMNKGGNTGNTSNTKNNISVASNDDYAILDYQLLSIATKEIIQQACTDLNVTPTIICNELFTDDLDEFCSNTGAARAFCLSVSRRLALNLPPYKMIINVRCCDGSRFMRAP